MSPVRHKMRRRPRSNPCGVLQVNARGYAFVKTAEGEVFVPASKRGGAFDGDMVEVALVSVNHKHRQPGKEHNQTGDKPTARVVRVIDRAHDYVTGRYEVAEPFGVVVPDDPRIPYDIFTLRSENPSLEDGAMVKVRITEYPSPRSAATGVIVEAAPAEEESDRATWALIARHKLETEFTAEALDQARSACLDEAAALAEGYRDLRDRLVFTIDPEDARDFDDALSLEEDEGMMRLGVHIADVARFVPWDCPLDSDAARRATSVYLADRVIPMLPEELSAELCSLKPGETRAALSVDLFLDSACRLVRYTVYPALIRSSARFSYEEVQNALEASGQCCAEGLLEGRGYSQGEALGGHRRNCAADPAFRGRLERLDRIARTLSAQRKRTGGIDFSTCEAKVRLDASGRPEAILLRKRTAATALVEEAMILANTTIAGFLAEHGLPGIFRVHDAPASDGLAALVPIIREFDYLSDIPAADFVAGNPFCIQEVLERTKGKPEEELVSNLVLRAMQRAEYRACADGHFGLARSQYLHFTSPIRRYPDLVVHRIVKSFLQGTQGAQEQSGAQAAKDAQGTQGTQAAQGAQGTQGTQGTQGAQGAQEQSGAQAAQAAQGTAGAQAAQHPRTTQSGKGSKSAKVKGHDLALLAEHSSKQERIAEAAARESQEMKMIEFLAHEVGSAFDAVISGVARHGLFVRLANTAEGMIGLDALGNEYFAFDPQRHTLTGEESGKSYRLGQRVRVVLQRADQRLGRLDFRMAGSHE